MTVAAIQKWALRAVTIVTAALLAAFAASFAYTFFAVLVVTVAGFNQGVPMAVMDGLMAVAIVIHLSPVVVGGFLLGSLCVGIPTYLILRRMDRTGPWTLAVAGALLSGLTGILVLGALGPIAILPMPPAGAIGALIFQIVASRAPMRLAKPAPPS